MSGPKIDIEQVQAAIAVVDDATGQMNGVTSKVLAQADAATAAISAPAGQITSVAYSDLSGAGKALAEELVKLRADLAALISVAQSGSDDATAAASRGSLAEAISTAV